jgi:hypothetical protein
MCAKVTLYAKQRDKFTYVHFIKIINLHKIRDKYLYSKIMYILFEGLSEIGFGYTLYYVFIGKTLLSN